jgi:glycosyltransferase involved in cell wall biosynthesis
MGGWRSVCFYTPSTDPSGMGAHMLDLIEEYVPTADVSLMVRPTRGGQAMLDRAARLGAATLALPSPRSPQFPGLVTEFLADHPTDVFHVHVGTGSENWDGARLARASGVPAIVQTQHLPYLVAHPRKRRAFHCSIEPVDRIIAVSEGLRRTYIRVGVPPGRIVTVPNGVAPAAEPPDRAAARRVLGLDDDQPVVLTVARLTHMKGQHVLLDAVPGLAARFPGLAVVLIGDGPLRERLTAQAAALGVGSAVRFLGHRADARRLLPAADIFALPSRHEGMPLAALEAMATGLPVVATRVIGTDEVVEDGVTGLLVRPADPVMLEAALAALLADTAQRRAQGQAGHRRWRECFTRRRMAAATAAVYEQTLAAVGAAGGLPV